MADQPTRHPSAEEEEVSASSAFVYARRRDSDVSTALVHLEQGTAEDMRHTARTQLRCPVVSCTNPDITTVRRAHLGRRDGFAHLARGVGDHNPESILHARIKAAVAAAVTQQHPLVSAEEEVPCVDGQRRADVLLTWPDGALTAVEVQVSALGVLAWQERHDSYRGAGIRDVWILPGSADDDGRVRADALLSAIVADGTQAVFVDIDKGLIALPHRDKRLPLPDETFSLWWQPIAVSPWSPAGVWADAWGRLVVRRDEHENAVKARRAELDAALAATRAEPEKVVVHAPQPLTPAQLAAQRERERLRLEAERERAARAKAAQEAREAEWRAEQARRDQLEAQKRAEREARRARFRHHDRNRIIARGVLQQRASAAPWRRAAIERAVDDVVESFTDEGFDPIEFLMEQREAEGENLPVAMLLARLRTAVPAAIDVESTILRMFLEHAGKLLARLGMPVLAFMDAAADLPPADTPDRHCTVCGGVLPDWARGVRHPWDVCGRPSLMSGAVPDEAAAAFDIDGSADGEV